MALPLNENEGRVERLAPQVHVEEERKFNILLVDDRPENLLALETILEDLGQNLVAVRSGKDALRELLHRSFAVILLDIHMPSMDGYETAELIRQRLTSEYTPIIFVTAWSAGETPVSRGYSLGAVDYLFSPLQPEIVRAKVSVFLELARKNAIIKEQADLLRAESDRRASRVESRMQALLNRLEVGVYRSTAEGQLLDANPAFLRLFKLGSPGDWSVDLLREAGTGRSFKEILGCREPANTTTPMTDHDVEFPNGRRLSISIRKTVTAPDGEQPCVDGIIADVSDRKIQERLLKESNRALQRSNEDLNQFAYAASHDLREPLRMVATYSELLDRSMSGRLTPEAEEFIGFIIDGASRMERIVNDLLSYARAANDAGDTPPQPIDAGRALDAALLNLHKAVEDSEASITRDDLPTVAMHERHLIQILQNLLGNAIKYRSRERLMIHVACRRVGNVWRFSVSDNGIGIAPEFHRQIFGMFRRLHGSEYPGTGIGLAICAKIVDWYGGRIWVESAPGQGSTFHFEIP